MRASRTVRGGCLVFDSVTTDDNTFECGNCSAQMSGYSKRELRGEGWRSHVIDKNRDFWLCDACSPIFVAKWDAKKATGA